MLEVFIILILLQIKHWYIDFVNQTNEEIQLKGVYGNWKGIRHSVKHGLASILIFALFAPPGWAIILGIVDALFHYHIDWVKSNKGNKDVNDPEFWNHLGLDQLAHQIIYILLVRTLIL